MKDQPNTNRQEVDRILSLLAEREAQASTLVQRNRDLADRMTQGLGRWTFLRRRRQAIVRTYATAACLALVFALTLAVAVDQPIHARSHNMAASHAVGIAQNMLAV